MRNVDGTAQNVAFVEDAAILLAEQHIHMVWHFHVRARLRDLRIEICKLLFDILIDNVGQFFHIDTCVMLVVITDSA